MSDDPPGHTKRWRGARRPPSRLATAITLFALGASAVGCAGREDPPVGGEGGIEFRSPAATAESGCPARPWLDTLLEVSTGRPAPTCDGGLVVFPPVQVPPAPVLGNDPGSSAEPKSADEPDRRLADEPDRPTRQRTGTASRILVRHRARDPSWPDTVGRLLARRDDEPDRVTIENYFLYLPPGFAADGGEWPVLLYLHGRSLRGDDLTLVARYGIPSLIERGYELPFVVLAPQLPDGQHWVDVDRLWELLDEVVLERYPVDEDRVYVTGYSMGAGGAWRFAVGHADQLAAAVPISASTPPPSEAWTEALEDLPMLVYHGDRDELVPYELAVEMVEHLREAGQEIDLITLEGEGHGIVQDVYGDPELYVWLLAHER